MIDLIGITGMLLIAGGAYWVYEPAGPIVAGILMLSGAVIAAKRQAPTKEDDQ